MSSSSSPRKAGSELSPRGGRSAERRRQRAALERQILEAAETFLETHPLRELTVDEVMRRTGLSRTNFYRLFPDREGLFLRLVAHVEAEMEALTAIWHQGEGVIEDEISAALAGVASVYAEHGAVLRALADGSALEEGLRRVYDALIERFIEATRHRIEREVAAGRARVGEPRATAEVLVLMTERSMRYAYERETPMQIDRLVAALAPVWSGALRPPAP